ncbi:MAG: SH3 domain-containing protein [Polyangiaceae bacterium]|nr:SH3 domain-containing protein [Polyangiaceae bacterium]
MQRRNRPLEVAVPTKDHDRPRWGRVGLFVAGGLAIGLAWPRLAGVRIGPEVPGAKDPTVAAAGTVAGAAPAPSASAPPAAALVTAGTSAPGTAPPSHKQRVDVGQGTIAQCWNKKNEKLDPNECGPLPVDRVLVPPLKQLVSCPSAIGLYGELEVGFDLNFDKGEVKVVRGKKSELPGPTVNGILACTADFISDISHEKIPHKHAKYRVIYTITFPQPGSAATPATAPSDSASAGPAVDPDLATVSWDSVLVRDEPKTGKELARLVRGTRVKLLGRRKDWCRIQFQGKEGWVHRSAIGL